MARAYAEGIGWGDAKQALFERVDAELAPLREKYEALIAQPAEIEAVLRDGAARLRASHATPMLARLREAVGLRDLSRVVVDAAADADAAAEVVAPLPVFKQYREADGRFHFKLSQGERVLLQSAGFEQPREAGQRIAALRREGFAGADAQLSLGAGVDIGEVRDALARLAVADEAKA